MRKKSKTTGTKKPCVEFKRPGALTKAGNAGAIQLPSFRLWGNVKLLRNQPATALQNHCREGADNPHTNKIGMVSLQQFFKATCSLQS
jgi:hypothetical protein